MNTRRNPVPGWVRDVLMDDRSFDVRVEPVISRLMRRVPPSWLPLRHGDALADELGCGAFGCVLATGDPELVLKLTNDEDEAVFVAWLLSLGEQPPYWGIVRYHGILDTGWTHGVPVFDPKAVERHERDAYASSPQPIDYVQRPVRLIWRERAVHVGIFKMKTRPSEPLPPEIMKPTGFARAVLRAEWHKRQEGWGSWAEETFEEFLAKKAERADRLMAQHATALERWRMTRWFTPEEIAEARRMWEGGLSHYHRTAKAFSKLHARAMKGKNVDARDLEIAEGRVAAAVDELKNFPAARWLALTLRALLERGVILYDLHYNNVGIVVRDGEERWVVTDPSQVVFLSGAPAVTIPSA